MITLSGGIEVSKNAFLLFESPSKVFRINGDRMFPVVTGCTLMVTRLVRHNGNWPAYHFNLGIDRYWTFPDKVRVFIRPDIKLLENGHTSEVGGA